MRLGLRTVVEAEDAFDDAAEWGGDLDGAAAHAAGAGGMLVTVQFDAECVAECGDGAAEEDGAAGAVHFDDFQFILCGEGADFFDVRGSGAVAGGELHARKMMALRGQKLAEFFYVGKLFGGGAAAEEDGYLDLFLGVAWADLA